MFMMQYYAYILMFVVFDVMSIFLYAWGTALFNIPRSATLPIIGFLAIMFTAMGYALLYLGGERNLVISLTSIIYLSARKKYEEDRHKQ